MKLIKTKKLLLGLGAVSFIGFTTFSVVSCSSTKNEQKETKISSASSYNLYGSTYIEVKGEALSSLKAEDFVIQNQTKLFNSSLEKEATWKIIDQTATRVVLFSENEVELGNFTININGKPDAGNVEIKEETTIPETSYAKLTSANMEWSKKDEVTITIKGNNLFGLKAKNFKITKNEDSTQNSITGWIIDNKTSNANQITLVKDVSNVAFASGEYKIELVVEEYTSTESVIARLDKQPPIIKSATLSWVVDNPVLALGGQNLKQISVDDLEVKRISDNQIITGWTLRENGTEENISFVNSNTNLSEGDYGITYKSSKYEQTFTAKLSTKSMISKATYYKVYGSTIFDLVGVGLKSLNSNSFIIKNNDIVQKVTLEVVSSTNESIQLKTSNDLELNNNPTISIANNSSEPVVLELNESAPKPSSKITSASMKWVENNIELTITGESLISLSPNDFEIYNLDNASNPIEGWKESSSSQTSLKFILRDAELSPGNYVVKLKNVDEVEGETIINNINLIDKYTFTSANLAWTETGVTLTIVGTNLSNLDAQNLKITKNNIEDAEQINGWVKDVENSSDIKLVLNLTSDSFTEGTYNIILLDSLDVKTTATLEPKKDNQSTIFI